MRAGLALIVLAGCGGRLESEPCQLVPTNYEVKSVVTFSTCAADHVGDMNTGAVFIDPANGTCAGRVVEFGPSVNGTWTRYDLTDSPATIEMGGTCTVVYSAEMVAQ